MVPHGSSVYSHHAVITFTNTPFSEFLMTSLDCSTMRPQFDPHLSMSYSGEWSYS